jgi:hypothetical protein
MRKITTSIPLRFVVSVALIAATVAFAPVNMAVAQDWRIEPAFRVGAEFDDNATLNVRTDEEVELQGYLLDLSADFSYGSPTSSFTIQPRLLSRNYSDEPDFDSNDYFLRSRYVYTGQANTFGFRVNFDSQAIRTAEGTDSDLDIEDPDEIPGTGSGRTFISGQRDNWWFVPYWRYQISDTSSFGATVSYTDATYDEQLVQVLNDYTDFRINLDYRHAISAATTLVYGATTRRYDSSNSLSQIDGYGFSGGFERAISETMRLSARIGAEKTDTPEFQSDPEFVGNISLSRSLKTINLFLQFRRGVEASGIRSLSVRDSLSLNFRRRLSEKIAAGLGVRAYKSRGIGNATIDDRNYVQLHASMNWYLTPTFTVDAEYRYSVLDRKGQIDEGSNSNRINVWFTWQPRTAPSN